MLLKSVVSPSTNHYTANLGHIPPDEIIKPWVVIQLYSDDQKKTLKEWFGSFYDKARVLDIESDARRVLNYMIKIGESDRIRFTIDAGKLIAKYTKANKEVFYISDIDAATQLTQKDEQL